MLAPFLSLCQDECPLITAAFTSLQHDVQAAGLAHRVVFVEATVDPGRDTVARLAAYQKEFGADWDLWTGTPAADRGVLEAVRRELPDRARGTAAQARLVDRHSPLTYDVDHTDGYILIDAAGRERFVDASAPNIPNLSPKLKALLNAGGLHDLAHPSADQLDDRRRPRARSAGCSAPTSRPSGP